MPRHDPVPPSRGPEYERPALAWERYKRFMRWMVLFAIATSLAAVAWLASEESLLSVHMLIATIAGVFLTVMVGTGLMGLVFLSNRTGHDEDAAQGGQDDDR